jgi:uncharacterized membrane protein YfcA
MTFGSGHDYTTLAAAAVLIGLSKGGLGGPLPTMLATLMLTQRGSVATAVALATPMLMVGDAFAMYTYWRLWDRTHTRALIPAGVLGVLIGLSLLRGLPDRSLRVGLGLAGLVVVGYKILSHWRGREHYQRRPWHAPLAGLLSGVSSGMLNAGGPPITSYLLLQPISPVTFMGITTLFFAVINTLKIPGSLMAGVVTIPALLWSLAFCPLVAVGVYAGRFFIARVQPEVFDQIMTAILVFACLWLIATAYL